MTTKVPAFKKSKPSSLHQYCMRLLLAASITCTSACTSTTRIYLIRHAERDSGVNPHLNADGQRRAIALCDSMLTKNITMILTTDSNRTKETVRPTGNRLNIPLTLYSPDTLAGVATLLKNKWGKNILVVTHSELIVPFLSEFNLTTTHTLPFTDFDNLFVIKRSRTNGQVQVTFTEGRYGENSPP